MSVFPPAGDGRDPVAGMIRTVVCPSCDRSFDETDREWDQARVSRACPFCGHSLHFNSQAQEAASFARRRRNSFRGIAWFSLAVGLLAFIGSAIGIYNNRSADTPEEIQKVMDLITQLSGEVRAYREKTGLADATLRFNERQRKGFDDATTTLSWWNKRIAQAKLIRTAGATLVTEYGYVFMDAQEVNEWVSRPFESEHPLESALVSAGWGMAVGIGVAVLLLMSLALVRYAWYFLLARVREFGEAIRGK
jgi:hypothetical protein